jgi:hypothetical protein
MSDPWDIPPFPPHGDDDADDTYKMVGRCLTEWEETEYLLSQLYSQFRGNPAHVPTMRQYGQPTIFAERTKILRTTFKAFITKHPNQNVEGDFDDLMQRITRFADRRNEIAHGVVRPLQWVLPRLSEYEAIRNDPLQYALIPPLYTNKKLDALNRPTYIYTANELTQFYMFFHELGAEALHFQIVIDGMRHPSPPKRRGS